MKIKKGVILAAGIGSRLYPMTKSIPKSMLPVVDRPAIDYIIDEAFRSGIEEIAIVCNHQEEVLKHYLSEHPSIHFIHQENTFGTAYALKSAMDFIDERPFSLFLGDEIVIGPSPCMKQLKEHFEEETMDAITGIEKVSEELLKEYNCVSFEVIGHNKLLIKDIVEKPQSDFFSHYTSIGRYIISGKSIISFLETLPKTPSQEIPLTNFFRSLTKTNKFYGFLYSGTRFDIGTKDKWLKTNIQIHQMKSNSFQ